MNATKQWRAWLVCKCVGGRVTVRGGWQGCVAKAVLETRQQQQQD